MKLLVTVRDEKDIVVVFTHTKVWNLPVAAYKRNLFDKPIGHAVQMTAMKNSKKLVASYQLGKNQHLSSPNLIDKELSISYFKEGFAGHIYVNLI